MGRGTAKWIGAIVAITSYACVVGLSRAEDTSPQVHREPHGAIFRGDTSTKKLTLVFTADEHGESTTPILDALRKRNIKAAFFLTGNFLRQREFEPLVQRILTEGHYLGPHSDNHLLYCDWEDRHRTLVTKARFTADLEKNIADLRVAGALRPGQTIYFIPPYEWYNRDQAAWCEELDVVLINFTPGSGSNRDYAPEGDERFVPSQTIYDDILAYEERDPHGLNGFLLLFHLGSGRSDPFHPYLGPLLDELSQRGYQFVSVEQLLGQ